MPPLILAVNVGYYDFSIIGATNVRIDSAIDSGVGGSLANSLIQNIWIEHVKVGIWVDGPFSGLHGVGIIIRDTFADGINLHKGVSNVIIEQSMIRNTGDDGMAMWSDQLPDTGNTFRFNTIQVPVLANAIGIYGGSDNSANDNYVADSICEGGGLQVSNRFGSVLLSGVTTMARNTVNRCGAPNHDNTAHNGALWFWPQDGAMNSLVNINDTVILDSSYAGITFWGSQLTNTHFNNITITMAPYAIEVNGLNGQAYFKDVVASRLTTGGIHSCDSGFKLVQESGDSGWSDTHCN